MDHSPVPEANPEIHERRKADHIRINLEEDVAFRQLTTGLEGYFFVHQALPELDLHEVDTSLTLFGKRLQRPLLISSMTGGTQRALEINRTAAQEAHGEGSVRRAALADPLAATYQVRDVAPDIPLLPTRRRPAQLRLRRPVQRGDSRPTPILHLNALQEAVQPEGDGNFAGLLARIEEVCRQLPVPVIAKEVGWGFSGRAARQLADAGVAAIDVAGAGGTSWSQVEMHRAPTARHARVAGAFIDWGIPTAVSIRLVRQAAPDLPIFASGGIKNGIDIAKCIAMGATLGGLAGEFLRAADQGGVEGVLELAGALTDELRVAMFASGARDLAALARTPLYRTFDELLQENNQTDGTGKNNQDF